MIESSATSRMHLRIAYIYSKLYKTFFVLTTIVIWENNNTPDAVWDGFPFSADQIHAWFITKGI